MRFTVDEYSKEFGLQRDVVLFKLKTDQLNYIIEDNITYIIVTKSSLNKKQRDRLKNPNNTQMPAVNKSAKTTVRFILSLYKQENQLLKDKIKELELKIDKLVADKEQMLRDERDKLEKFYATKDNQLKQILELVNTKFLQNQPQKVDDDIINVSPQSSSPLIELKEYLRSMDITSSQKKRIKKRFLQLANQDVRVIQQNGKLYLDFAKYDYTDLLKIS